MRRKVIVDVDTGTDDAMALMVLLAADLEKEIQILGITCVRGNTSLPNVCRNTLRLLRVANRLDIPVFAGAECALIAERQRPEMDGAVYHGSDGFGDLSHHDDDSTLLKLLQKENGVIALNRLVMEHPGEITLVCLAPLTNVALAMRTFPDFRKNIRDMHVMGGNIRGRGNITPTAEFNFAADPEAAHIVLETTECPIQLTPWEITTEHPIPVEWRWSTLSAAATENRGDRGHVLELVNAADRSVFERLGTRHWVACDVLAVAGLVRPALVLRTHRTHASVELAGSRTRGQMVASRRLCLERGLGLGCADLNAVPDPDCTLTILDALDLEGFKELLLWAARRCQPAAPPRDA